MSRRIGATTTTALEADLEDNAVALRAGTSHQNHISSEPSSRARIDGCGEATLHFLPWPGVAPSTFASAGDHRRPSDDLGIEPGEDVLVFTLR